MYRNILLGVVAILISLNAGGQNVYDLRTEGMKEPLGIDNIQPHFSWIISSKNPFFQTAYELEVASSPTRLKEGKADVWKSGEVLSDETVMVAYKGNQLQPRQMYYWHVRSKSHKGWTPWSDIQRFGIGIIKPDKMRGEYIGMGLGQAQSILLRKTFQVKQKKGTAILHVNSLGYHEAYLNGKPVSQAVLTPAVSQMDRRSQIVTYDVTSLLRKGKNTLVIWAGSGWYKKETFKATFDGAVVRADLDLLTNDNIISLEQTDASWQGRIGGYEDTGTWEPGQFGGERIDASKVPNSLSTLEKEQGWQKVKIADIKDIEATPQMCQFNKIKETLTPVSIANKGNGRWLVDMGRVVNGLFEINLHYLQKGHEVKASYCDHLQELDKFENSYWGDDIFISSGEKSGDTFRNRFNHHVFRYVLLSGLPYQPDSKDIRVHRIGMDIDSIGSFESSDNDMNRIYQLISHTMEGLMWGGYMVDCASIERLGYGGDGNASTLSLQNTFDVAPLYMNWIQAWRDATRPDGSVPHTAPNPYKAGGGPYWCSFIIQAPWRTWWNFGDERPMRLTYETMKLWLQYVDKNSRDGLLYRWPDEEFRNWYLGDWLAPKGINVQEEESINLVNNCVLSQCYAELIQMAEHLGQQADKEEFIRRRETLNNLIHKVFYHPELETYGTGSQLDFVYPLLVGAVPQDIQSKVRRKLIEGWDHLGVGLVGVPVLTEWATQNHEADYMYRMLKQPDYPGYLYMVNQGATGTWEDWQDPRSYFHNCYNGIGSWFYQALGGIIPTKPGYKTVLINPQHPHGLQWVRVSRHTPYGTLIVNWEQEGSRYKLHLKIPNGITATIGDKELGAGEYDM